MLLERLSNIFSVRAVTYANGGRLRARTDQEQLLWSECSRFLSNCVIFYDACILSELLDYAEREKNHELADRIKRISPVSWKHVNFYGEYTFQESGNIIDLAQMIDRLIALETASFNKLRTPDLPEFAMIPIRIPAANLSPDRRFLYR
jgi:hypothetical protein